MLFLKLVDLDCGCAWTCTHVKVICVVVMVFGKVVRMYSACASVHHTLTDSTKLLAYQDDDP